MSAAESLPRPLDGMQTRTLDELFGALRQHDLPTASHSAWVAQYGRAMAATIGLPREDRKLVYVAGLMPDVGKLFCPTASSRAPRSSTRPTGRWSAATPSRAPGWSPK